MIPNLRKTYKLSIQTVAIYLSIIYTIIFPADILNLKEIFLLVALFVGMPAIVSSLVTSRNVFLFFYGILYPIVTFSYSITIGESTLENAISYGYVWVFLLLVPCIIYYKIDVKKPFIFATFIVAAMINFIALSDYFGFISFYSNPALNFLIRMNEIQYGKGIISTFGYSLFYKSCPLIIFSYGYALKNRKLFLSLFFLVSLLASGTRANFYSAVILTVLMILFSELKKGQKMLLSVGVCIIIILVSPSILERMIYLNYLKIRSDSIKDDAVQSIIKFLNEDPSRYIFGSGVGSAFYSSGRGEYTTVVEVSYYDYFRQVGLIGFIFFLNFIFKPMLWLFKNLKWLFFSYVAYLAIAYTNPLLVTSTSFMAYVLILSNVFLERKESFFVKTK